jgi:hypothetical protein
VNLEPGRRAKQPREDQRLKSSRQAAIATSNHCGKKEIHPMLGVRVLRSFSPFLPRFIDHQRWRGYADCRIRS